MAASLAEFGFKFCIGSTLKFAFITRVSCRCNGLSFAKYKLYHRSAVFSHVQQRLVHTSRPPLYTTERATPLSNDRVTPIRPHDLVGPELRRLHGSIKEELRTVMPGLKDLSHYHFDGKGKSFRPMLIMILSKALNAKPTDGHPSRLLPKQEKIAQIAEMIHVASLIHDDVIDGSDVRRGKPSVHHSWDHAKAVIAGNYILSAASSAIARLGHPQVVIILAKVVEDLVRGEFMQLGSKENEDERFAHYLEKTYKKTASLMANSCKAVAVVSDESEEMVDTAYHIGRNIGIAFQLVDDMLDFVSSDLMMGKPTTADLKLGLATGPVLFACQKFPELHAMIMRRFGEVGDVERARQYVSTSDGIQQTRLLAEAHCQEAIKYIERLQPSTAKLALINLTQLVLSRSS